MANITEILGTDSVSSSRPTINSNFELLNDELASVLAMLNPTTSVLQGLTSATTQALTVNNNGDLFVVNSTGATFSTPLQAANVNVTGRIVKSGSVGDMDNPTATVAPSEITKGAYFIDQNFTLPTAVDGTEVTLINAGSTSISVLGGTGVSIGATSIALGSSNSNVTLRCFANQWFVVASHGAQIA